MSRGRLFFTVTTILLLLGTGAFWILSNENIIQNSWSLPLGTGFGILGVLVGFCQWALPFPSVEAKTPADIAASEAQESFIKQIYDRLTEGNGAVIIYEKMTHIGQDVELKVKRKIISGYEKNWEEHSRANVVERTVNGRSLVAAVFPDLKPGTYQKKWGEEITVLPRQVTEIDLRGQSEKAEKRQSLFTSLRWASVAIGVGGSLFLASRYSTNVSVNQYLLGYGLGLMGLGVLTLIFSLLLY